MRAAKFDRDRKLYVDRKVDKLVKSLPGDSMGGVGHPSCAVMLLITVILFVCFVVYRFQPPSLHGRDHALGACSEESLGSKCCCNPRHINSLDGVSRGNS